MASKGGRETYERPTNAAIPFVPSYFVSGLHKIRSERRMTNQKREGK